MKFVLTDSFLSIYLIIRCYEILEKIVLNNFEIIVSYL